MIGTLRFDILLLTETWLTDKFDDFCIVNNNNYSLFRSDRRNKRGGGVCAIIKSKFQPGQIFSKSCKCFDLLVIEVTIPQPLRIILVYFPPSKISNTEVEILCEELSNWACTDKNFILIGDFNLPNLYKSILDESAKIFTDFIHSINCTQMVYAPTRYDNFLDLLFANNQNLISQISVQAPLLNSDHKTIHFNIKFDSGNSTKKDGQKFMLDYHNANYHAMNALFANFNWNGLFNKFNDVNGKYQAFSEIVQMAIDYYVPKIPSSEKSRNLPDYISKLLNHRDSLLPLLHNYNIAQKFSAMSRRIEKWLNKYLKNKEKRILTTSAGFYKYIRNRVRSKKS